MKSRQIISINNVLCVIIFIGLIFRFFYPFFSNPFGHLYSDPHKHYYSVIEDHFGKDMASLLDPPLPQIILKAALFIFGNTIFGVSAYLGLLCAITPWCWYRWGRLIFPSKTTALVFMTVITYLPSWISIYSYFMDETLLLPFLGITLWLSWRARKKGTLSSLLLATFFWAITTSIKLNTAFELILVMSWLLFCFWKEHKSKAKTAFAVCSVVTILGVSYLTYPLWVYKGLGFTWLFPPGMGILNRGWHRSNAITYQARFTYKGRLIHQTGDFASRASWAQNLQPFSDWSTWREGSFNYHLDFKQPVTLTMPVADLSWKKRLRNLLEESLHLIFGESWPDDRDDDPVQWAQVKMNWLWSILIVSTLILAIKKRQMKNILVILSLGTISAYIISDSSMLDGRYRKPWEGIALAAFIFLCTTPSTNSKTIPNAIAKNQNIIKVMDFPS